MSDAIMTVVEFLTKYALSAVKTRNERVFRIKSATGVETSEALEAIIADGAPSELQGNNGSYTLVIRQKGDEYRDEDNRRKYVEQTHARLIRVQVVDANTL